MEEISSTDDAIPFNPQNAGIAHTSPHTLAEAQRREYYKSPWLSVTFYLAGGVIAKMHPSPRADDRRDRTKLFACCRLRCLPGVANGGIKQPDSDISANLEKNAHHTQPGAHIAF